MNGFCQETEQCRELVDEEMVLLSGKKINELRRCREDILPVWFAMIFAISFLAVALILLRVLR